LKSRGLQPQRGAARRHVAGASQGKGAKTSERSVQITSANNASPDKRLEAPERAS
jgi:hypothetical protein